MIRVALPAALPIAVLLLAGCNNDERMANNANDMAMNEQRAKDDGTVVPVGNEAAMPGNQSDAADDDDDMASATGALFPAAFQGRWGLVANDCTSTRGDNKGLLTVTGDTLRFYESRGTVDTLTMESSTRVRADLDFEGEGQTWEKTATFTVADGGKTLVRTESDPALNLRYSRCPA